MNIFVLSEALLLFDRKIHMENSSIKRVLCAGEGDHLNIFIRVRRCEMHFFSCDWMPETQMM